jgi:hypothetical protein
VRYLTETPRSALCRHLHGDLMMYSSRKLPQIALFMMLAACGVGEVSDGTPDSGMTGGAGENSFNTMIKPLVTECTGCHGSGTKPILSSYASLTADAKYKAKPGAMNILVTKADATGGTHQGVTYFSAMEKTTVGNWIDSLP